MVILRVISIAIMAALFDHVHASSEKFLLTALMESHPGSSDITCLFEHCTNELGACMADMDCMRASLCVAPCKDQSCIMHCMINYGNDILDDFLNCASTEHACIIMPSQDPPVQCSIPDQTDSTFQFKSLTGEWNVLLGLNPTYDCFPCQVTSFGAVNQDGSIDAVMSYQAMTDKGVMKKLQQESTLVPDGDDPSLIHLSSYDYGSTLEDDWLIIDHEENKFTLVYYCGKMPTGGGDYWFYEGGVLYSKTKSLNQLDYDRISQSATNAGLNLKEWCPVDHGNCLA
ncbi:uncharacterized protein LOC143455799 [Clavelina lepadiformis]|uniref:VDE lipocalin domain-containing protein n=1 Tax=Clavelina lepadiformis TaxID=159417 RepID=A0ABP0FXU2_CLALP